MASGASDALRNVGAVALLGVLCGCATMTPDECRQADWYTVGYEDGVQGEELSILSLHRETCAKAGIVPDRALYEAGRDEGIRVYCEPGHGYRLGRAGQRYAGVCPADMEYEFLAAHGEGMAIFNLELDVQEVESAIAYVDNAMADAEHELDESRRTLDENEDLTSELRRHLRDEIEELSREIGRMEAERDRLMVELGVRRERLREHLDGPRY